ncbi:hypothetical protein BC940DRAFT_308971 [Gongronella butleri]|nr:hypothetical protein BC940DRAFT_308971 [Gongronella butleri]
MVQDKATDDLICWSDDGKSFFVKRHEEFAKSVLPRFFKHSNFSSFVRQLNMYGFHKVPHLQHGVLHAAADSEQWEFTNPYFQRNQPELLLLVTRKKSKDTDEHTTTNANATNGNASQPQNQSGTAINLHHILEEIQSIKQHQLSISQQLKTIQNDNTILWRETMDARERHQRHQDTIDKILRFLASVFSNDKSSSMAIPRKRRYLLEGPPGSPTTSQTNDHHHSDAQPRAKYAKITNVDDDQDQGLNLSAYVKNNNQSNPTSELADAIALNNKAKQSTNMTSPALRPALPTTGQSLQLPQELTQMMNLQQVQNLISIAQSNPQLFGQLTADMLNSYHQQSNSNPSIPATSSPGINVNANGPAMPPSSLQNHSVGANDASAMIDPFVYSHALTQGVGFPSAPTTNASSAASTAASTPSINSRIETIGSPLSPALPSQHSPTATSKALTAFQQQQLQEQQQQQFAQDPVNGTIVPPPHKPTLPQVANDLHSAALTADDITNNIDNLGTSIEALAQQLGINPMQTGDDILGYVDMDKLLEAYGKTPAA